MSKYRRYNRRKFRPYHLSPIEIGLASAVLLGLAGVSMTNRHLFSLTSSIFIITSILAVAFLVLLIVASHQHRSRMRAIKLSGVDEMDGVSFEKYLKYLLESRGHKHVVVTTAQGDYGADLVAIKDGEKYAIQAKRYSKPVGVEAIYQVLGGGKYYTCDKTMVVTNSYFTPQVKQLAEKTETILIDRDTLAQWIEESKNPVKK